KNISSATTVWSKLCRITFTTIRTSWAARRISLVQMARCWSITNTTSTANPSTGPPSTLNSQLAATTLSIFSQDNVGCLNFLYTTIATASCRQISVVSSSPTRLVSKVMPLIFIVIAETIGQTRVT